MLIDEVLITPTAAEAPNRMVRRKNQTRKKLLDAAVSLVLNRGYDTVVTDEITELADVGRRTFYNHFDNKRDCVLAAVKDRYANYAHAMKLSLEATGADSNRHDYDAAMIIATMAYNMFELIATDPLTEQLMDYPRLLNEAVTESQRDFITINIANGLMAGRFKPSLPTESIEPVLTWGFVGLVMTAITRRSQQTDSLVWCRFLLQTLGIEPIEIEPLLESIQR